MDENGQPINRRFGAQRLNNRMVDELIGLCRGIIADNRVDESEGKFLLSWLESNHEIHTEYPANVI